MLLMAGAAAARAQDDPPDPGRPEEPPVATLPATMPAELPEALAEHVGPPQRVAIDVGLRDEDWGRIVIELYEHEAPLTTAHFLRYVDDNFYENTIFHRVIPGFVVQGGQYVNPVDLKQEGLRRSIRNEARNGVKNEERTVALARTRDPHSGNVQFFFNLADNPRLDHPGKDGFGYTVFGKVVEGWDVVERIAGVKTHRHPVKDVDSTPSLPMEPPVIKRIHRLPSDAAATQATSAPATAAAPAAPETTVPIPQQDPAPEPQRDPEPIPDEAPPT
jgi:cyclophilin family peptidyl-prolyl cis-trans isomerase